MAGSVHVSPVLASTKRSSQIVTAERQISFHETFNRDEAFDVCNGDCSSVLREAECAQRWPSTDQTTHPQVSKYIRTACTSSALDQRSSISFFSLHVALYTSFQIFLNMRLLFNLAALVAALPFVLAQTEQPGDDCSVIYVSKSLAGRNVV